MVWNFLLCSFKVSAELLYMQNTVDNFSVVIHVVFLKKTPVHKFGEDGPEEREEPALPCISFQNNSVYYLNWPSIQ